MARTQIINGNFQDAEGNVLARGYLILQLSADEQIIDSPGGQVTAGFKVKVNLDDSGNVIGSSTSPTEGPVLIWANNKLNPANSYYTVMAYTAIGQLAWGPEWVRITAVSTNPYDLDNWQSVVFSY